MAEKEFYRLDLVIGTEGVQDTEKQIKLIDKLIQDTERRAAALSKMKITPSVSIRNQQAARSASDRMVSTTTRISGNIEKMNTGMRHVHDSTERAGKSMEKINKHSHGASNGIFSMYTGMLKMSAAAGMVAATFAPVLVAIKGVKLSITATKLASDMEQARISYETMLGSKSKANSFLSGLENFAERTPFDFAGLRDTAQTMLAFKFKPEDIIPDLTSIGDWAGMMGKGQEGIDRVITALGQMKAKGRVQGDEMLQLTEAGINAYDYLSKAVGVSTAQLMKLQEKGLLPANQSIQAILAGMEKDFGGGMKRQEKTLLSLSNRMKETFSNKLLMRWGEGIRLAVQPRLQKVADWLDRNEATVKRWGDNLQKTSSRATNWIMSKFESTFNRIKSLQNDPAFERADFFGKIGIAWDKVITQPFENWWAAGGQKDIMNISSKIGEILGGGAKGIVLGGLSFLSPDKKMKQDENPYVQAGVTAGKAFFDAFVSAFDPGTISKKLGQVTWDTNKNAVTDPSWGNTAKAGILDYGLWALGGGALFSTGKKIARYFGKKSTSKGEASGSLAESSTKSTIKSVAEGASEAVEPKVLKVVKSPYSPGWNPRYVTPEKPEIPLKEVPMPGVSTAFKAVPLIAAGADAYSIIQAKPGEERTKKIGEKAGSWAGMYTGAETFGALGTAIFPGPGTIALGLVGGGLGYFGGGKVGNNLTSFVLNNNKEKKEIKQNKSYISMLDRLEKNDKENPGKPLFSGGEIRATNPSSSKTKSSDTQSVKLTDEQMASMKNFFQHFTQETTNQINVNLPPGAVQLHVAKDEVDYDSLAMEAGRKLSDAIRKQMQNTK